MTSDQFKIYTTTANYIGQSAYASEDIPDTFTDTPLFLYSKLSMSLCGGTYTYSRLKEDNEYDIILKAKNRWIPTVIILSFSTALCCVKWNAKFFEEGKSGQQRKIIDAPTICRNKDSLDVAQGFPIVEAACIAYAFDRLSSVGTTDIAYVVYNNWIRIAITFITILILAFFISFAYE